MRRASALPALLLLTACAPPGTVPGTGRSVPVEPVPSVSVVSSAVPDMGPRCVGGLLVRVSGEDAASGLRAVGIELHNCGTKPYQIKGYPELAVLGEDREPLDLRVLHGVGEVTALPPWQVEPKEETVEPGGSVSALLVWRNLTTDAETVAVGEFVRVAAAPGAPRHLLELHIDAGNTGKVAISPWVRRS
ncbi:DUF4232 domain-containing protein [Actinoplanes subglobosus]|uniref:DUF4232 domain-containing protein n=1 Tax=Actinoplanes subglobosus TaxID=1547892 RepID=A0ABV8J3A5_9ACTN